jgi:hypothetical protein
MQQQFWLWEKDSENIGSNLLVEYGFVRSTPPQQESGARCYEFDLENEGRIRLWSFGVMYCDPKHGAVFLQGPSYTPKLVGAKHAVVPAWVPEQILSPRTPRLPIDGKKMAHLMPPLLAWMGSYERWMLDTVGLEYRRGCVETWEAPVCDAEKLPAEWWSLAAKWREYLAAS